MRLCTLFLEISLELVHLRCLGSESELKSPQVGANAAESCSPGVQQPLWMLGSDLSAALGGVPRTRLLLPRLSGPLLSPLAAETAAQAIYFGRGGMFYRYSRAVRVKTAEPEAG